MAVIDTDDQGHSVACRFEVFANGLELANGYRELTDAVELEQRMLQDNVRRKQRGLEEVALDQSLLAAVRHGLPESAGVALGVDRLLMCLLDSRDIRSVIPFSLS